MEMKEQKVRVTDHETYPGNKTSKFLTKEEMLRIYPGTDPVKQSYIFVHTTETLVPKKQAEMLVRKYGKVLEIIGLEDVTVKSSSAAEITADVMEMQRPALINLAARLSIKNAMTFKNDPLRDRIIDALNSGATPIPQSEFKAKKINVKGKGK